MVFRNILVKKILDLYNKTNATLGLFNDAFGKHKYKRYFFYVISLGFLSGLFEGIGVNALIPLFSFVVGDGNGGTDFISRTIEKVFLLLNIDFSIVSLMYLVAVLFMLK